MKALGALTTIFIIFLTSHETWGTCICLRTYLSDTSNTVGYFVTPYNEFIANGGYSGSTYFGGYYDPPTTSFNGISSGIFFFGLSGGGISGRIFFNYDDVPLTASGNYTAVGCSPFNDATSATSGGQPGRCNEAYGFANANGCGSCGNCCCNLSPSINGVCELPQGD